MRKLKVYFIPASVLHRSCALLLCHFLPLNQRWETKCQTNQSCLQFCHLIFVNCVFVTFSGGPFFQSFPLWSLGTFPITVDFVSVFQSRRNSPHVTFNGTSPAFNITQLLEAWVEAVYQKQPRSSLLGKVCCIQMQLLCLRVQSFLVQISLKWRCKILSLSKPTWATPTLRWSTRAVVRLLAAVNASFLFTWFAWLQKTYFWIRARH